MTPLKVPLKEEKEKSSLCFFFGLSSPCVVGDRTAVGAQLFDLCSATGDLLENDLFERVSTQKQSFSNSDIAMEDPTFDKPVREIENTLLITSSVLCSVLQGVRAE